jgi:hypothetical protein
MGANDCQVNVFQVLDRATDDSLGQGLLFRGHFSSFLPSWIPHSESSETVTVRIGVAAREFTSTSPGRALDNDVVN